MVTCTDSITGEGVVDAYNAYLSVKKPCSDAVDCDNGIFCDGAESCEAGSCIAGQPVTCDADPDACNSYVCDESFDRCIVQQKADGTPCIDELYCNGLETCRSGMCESGTEVACNDGIDCTSDSCSETADRCEYLWPACGAADNCCGPECTSTTDADCSATPCWSGANTYLLKSDLQAMKFCSCAAGKYAFEKYSTITLKKAYAYKYTDTGDNSIWTVARVSTRNPIQSVECVPGSDPFYTNVDYFQ
jgi:hypothetical protein